MGKVQGDCQVIFFSAIKRLHVLSLCACKSTLDKARNCDWQSQVYQRKEMRCDEKTKTCDC